MSISEIGQGVFVGNLASAKFPPTGIQAVVNCTSNLRYRCSLPVHRFYPWKPRNMAEVEDMLYGIDAMIRFVANYDRVLFHCRGGRHRAPAVAIVALVCLHRLSRAEATVLVKSRRPAVQLEYYDWFIDAFAV